MSKNVFISDYTMAAFTWLLVFTFIDCNKNNLVLYHVVTTTVINYSPSCRSKPVRPSFIFEHKLRSFWWNLRAFCLSILTVFIKRS